MGASTLLVQLPDFAPKLVYGTAQGLDPISAKIRLTQPVAATVPTVPTGQGAKSAAEIQRSYWSTPSAKLSRQRYPGADGDCAFWPGSAKSSGQVLWLDPASWPTGTVASTDPDIVILALMGFDPESGG
jgi:hypothetical protein